MSSKLYIPEKRVLIPQKHLMGAIPIDEINKPEFTYQMNMSHTYTVYVQLYNL